MIKPAIEKIRAILARQDGVSLIEILVAAALVLFASISVFAAVGNNLGFTFQAGKIYRSALLAQARVDELKSFPFSEIQSDGAETDTQIDIDNDGRTDYYRTTVITQRYNNYPSLLKVKVSVCRTRDGKKVAKPVVMETLFSMVEIK